MEQARKFCTIDTLATGLYYFAHFYLSMSYVSLLVESWHASCYCMRSDE